jgi:hypothetical protein
VVEADRGQHGREGPDRVGRVEPSAEPGLDRGDLYPGLGQGEEGGRGRDLELGDFLTGQPRVDGVGEREQPAVKPWASQIAAIMRETDDLPLVPTTWMVS